MPKFLERLLRRRARLTPHQRAAQTRKRNWLAKSAAHRAEIMATIPALQTEAGQ